MIYQRQLQRLAPKTQDASVAAVAGLAKFSWCSPAQLSPEQIRTYLHPLVRRSSSCSIPIADGKDSEDILGSTAHLNSKGPGDKSLPIKPGTAEDAKAVARRDPRDMAKARLPAVQCHAVPGGPLATASNRQVDASPGQAEGRCDL